MQSRLREQLAKQLGFIERSCSAFDAGYLDEAIRIATAVRVLLHNTKRSTSLIAQLGAQSIRLLNTSPPSQPESGARRLYFNGLVTVRIDGRKSHLVAGLGNRPHQEFVPVDSWWNQVVWLLTEDLPVTRRDIVLAAANRDGGAHVDEALTIEYAELARDGAGGYYVLQGEPIMAPRPFQNAHLVSLRQIGYEVVHSPDLVALAA